MRGSADWLATALFGGASVLIGIAARDACSRCRRTRRHRYPSRQPYDDRVIQRIDAQVGDLVRQRCLDERQATAITPVLHRLARHQTDVMNQR